MEMTPRSRNHFLPQRKERGVLLLLFAAALILRLVLLGYVEIIETDGSYYGYLAGAVQSGSYAELLNPAWPPLYPALTGLAAGITGDLEAAGGLVSAICGALLVPLVYLLGRGIAGGGVGFVAAFLTAFHPRLVFFSVMYLTESLYTFVFIASLVLVSAALRRRNGIFLFPAGAVLALLYLTRPEGMIAGTAILVSLIVLSGSPGPAPKRRMAVWLLPLGAAVLLAPYVLALHAHTGRFSPTEKGRYNFHLTYRKEYRETGIQVVTGWMNRIPPTGPEADAVSGDGDGSGYESEYRIGTFLAYRWPAVLRHTARTFFINLFDKLPGAHYYVLFVLAALGIVLPRKRRAEEILWATVILVTIAAMSVYFPLRRFFVHFVPVLNIWAACALVAIHARTGRSLSGETDDAGGSTAARRLLPVAFLLVLVAAAATLYGAGKIRGRDYPVEYRRAGMWLLESEAGRIVVSARKPEISFYARSEFVPLPHTDPEKIGDWMEREGVTHLFLDARLIPRTHPELVPLLEEDVVPASLHVIYRDHGPAGKTVIFEHRPHAGWERDRSLPAPARRNAGIGNLLRADAARL